MTTVDCLVVDSERQLFKGKIASVALTTTMGELTVLPGHAALLAEFIPTSIEITHDNGSKQVLYLSGGFIEVQPNQVNIIADSSEYIENLDIQKIEQAQANAVKIMQEKSNNKIDYTTANRQLAVSLAQLRALKKNKKS